MQNRLRCAILYLLSGLAVTVILLALFTPERTPSRGMQKLPSTAELFLTPLRLGPSVSLGTGREWTSWTCETPPESRVYQSFEKMDSDRCLVRNICLGDDKKFIVRRPASSILKESAFPNLRLTWLTQSPLFIDQARTFTSEITALPTIQGRTFLFWEFPSTYSYHVLMDIIGGFFVNWSEFGGLQPEGARNNNIFVVKHDASRPMWVRALGGLSRNLLFHRGDEGGLCFEELVMGTGNRNLEPAYPDNLLMPSSALFSFGDLLLRGVGVQRGVRTVHTKPSVLFLPRNGTRAIPNEDEVRRAMERVLPPEASLQTFDSSVSIEEQMRQVTSANIFVCTHGAACTHMLFLPPLSIVIELFAFRAVNACYDLLAKRMGFGYIRWGAVRLEDSVGRSNLDPRLKECDISMTEKMHTGVDEAWYACQNVAFRVDVGNFLPYFEMAVRAFQEQQRVLFRIEGGQQDLYTSPFAFYSDNGH